jgi:hypothetical protein
VSATLHPSELLLEMAAQGERSEELVVHLDDCLACRDQVRQLRLERARFLAKWPAEEFVDRVLERTLLGRISSTIDRWITRGLELEARGWLATTVLVAVLALAVHLAGGGFIREPSETTRAPHVATAPAATAQTAPVFSARPGSDVRGPGAPVKRRRPSPPLPVAESPDSKRRETSVADASRDDLRGGSVADSPSRDLLQAASKGATYRLPRSGWEERGVSVALERKRPSLLLPPRAIALERELPLEVRVGLPLPELELGLQARGGTSLASGLPDAGVFAALGYRLDDRWSMGLSGGVRAASTRERSLSPGPQLEGGGWIRVAL